MQSRAQALSRLSFVAFAFALVLSTGVLRVAAEPARTIAPAPDFTLTDQNGQPFTLSLQRGHPVVLFFGYTHCPDECPTTLAHLAQIVHARGTPAGVRVAFVTIDRQRDSPRVLGRFVRLFDPNFVGLTGSAPQLRSVYEAYDVAFDKVPGKRGTQGYEFSHETTVYFIDRQSLLRGYGFGDDPTDKLAKDFGDYLS